MKNIGVVILCVLIAGAWQVAGGQVRRIRQGRALDASPQVGSGGTNYAVPQNYSPINTHISGIDRSRGLSAFMGHAPSLGSQLGLHVRDGGLSTFHRQSVGLGDIYGGGLYRPQSQVYNDPMRTVLRTPQIVRAESTGRVPLPGRASKGANKLARNLYTDATADYRPFMPGDVRNHMIGNALGTQLPRTGKEENLRWMNRMDSELISQRGGEHMFGMLRGEDRSRLAGEISALDQEHKDEDDYRGRLDFSVKSRRQDEPAEDSGEGLAERLRHPAEQQNVHSQQDIRPQRVKLHTDLPEENADAYLDLLIRLREQKMQSGKDGKKQGSMDEDDDLALRARRTGQLSAQMKNVELTGGKDVIIRRLAGSGEDIFNRYMRRAEKAMSAGRFYQAARHYELASMVRPQNPLAQLGRCLAAFAAGEYFTSAQHLRTAFELFPPLMQTRVDLLRLLPVKNAAKRLKAMENFIRRGEVNPVMIFLAAYMQYNYGHKDQARKHAETLMKTERVVRILRVYAEFILTGKLPADAKAGSGGKGLKKRRGLPRGK